jgi:hypothetical protein
MHVYTHTTTHTHTHTHTLTHSLTHTHTQHTQGPFILDPTRLLRALLLELNLKPRDLVRLAFDDVRVSSRSAGDGWGEGGRGGERVLVELVFVASMLPLLVSELACPENQVCSWVGIMCVYMCVYICMCVSSYTLTHTHTHTHTHTQPG